MNLKNIDEPLTMNLISAKYEKQTPNYTHFISLYY